MALFIITVSFMFLGIRNCAIKSLGFTTIAPYLVIPERTGHRKGLSVIIGGRDLVIRSGSISKRASHARGHEYTVTNKANSMYTRLPRGHGRLSRWTLSVHCPLVMDITLFRCGSTPSPR